MKLKDVKIAGKSLVLAKRAEVDALESDLWITLPKGYRDYVTQLGQGSLGSFVRVYPPWQIAKELTE
ncbi:MAG TPA: SMI1/KNR4 family protein, partial [Pirellulaceae bacterium]|nr:SMI1/KNR4 family protein [Pirellulaceae bacterium]